MAKSKKKDAAITTSVLDEVMAGIVGQQSAENGGSSDFDDRTLVIPMPGLVLEWFLGVNGWPLSRSCSLAAEPHVGKTAFLTEMVSWHRKLSGRGVVACTEGDKDAPGLRNSILRYDYKALSYENFKMLEDWQVYLTQASKKVMALFDKDPSLTTPVLFGTDSVVGALCRAKTLEIWKSGHAKADFATEAKLYGEWLRTFSNMALSNNPFTFVGTSHIYLQNASRPGFPPKVVVSGGMKQLFAAAICFLMKYVQKIDYVNLKGQIVNFSLMKNTVSGTRLFNNFDCGLYWVKGEDGVQQTWWDWDEATVWLLSDRKRFPPKGDAGSAVVEVCNIHEESGGMYWSKEIDVPRSDAMSAGQLGRLLHSKPELVSALRKALKIHEHRYFETGVKYEPVVLDAPIVINTEADTVEEAAEGVPLEGDA